jgi:hypothetical protein
MTTNRSWRHFSTMPFGKYEGWEIEDLPDGYLAWLLTIELRDWLRDAAQQEYDRRVDDRRREERQRRTPPPPPPAAPGIRLRPEDVPLARRLFDAGYRALVRVMHPDKGGDTREMQQLNSLAESMRTQIDALEAE